MTLKPKLNFKTNVKKKPTKNHTHTPPAARGNGGKQSIPLHLQAATAAAQDASDAVAALSAQVEKLVASLKAQLTSLTNLVIKIQKKVKA